ncbi:hypothetical protein LOTGIDRAFT_154671 [Lottia gigantea]|uniref:Uncharacterized protein n=1 Tax=Lottia gigantea TaxID=225164 RepID=V4BEA1_LOTGI|nr:hypothetical protein LOTGIDRAFT_154671 [Lottia gigantea]ESO87169.1 hypothetical protein LOTGIDRAFT_154671 [Lottia gigantea]
MAGKEDNDEYDGQFKSSGLYWGIKKGESKFVLECLRQGEPLSYCCSKTGNTYLHLIVTQASPMLESKYVPMIYQLSNVDFDLNVKNSKGETALDLSIKLSLLQIMVSLLKCGADSSDKHLELIQRHTKLFQAEFLNCFQKIHPGYWDAIDNNKTFKVNVLIKSWCRINISRNGKSLIEYAKESDGDEKIIKMLIDNEASIEFAHATIAGDKEKMELLLCNDSVDLQTKDLSNRESYFEPYSPLSLYGAAIKYGHKHTLDIVKGYKDPFMIKTVERQTSNANSSVCIIL